MNEEKVILSIGCIIKLLVFANIDFRIQVSLVPTKRQCDLHFAECI